MISKDPPKSRKRATKEPQKSHKRAAKDLRSDLLCKSAQKPWKSATKSLISLQIVERVKGGIRCTHAQYCFKRAAKEPFNKSTKEP